MPCRFAGLCSGACTAEPQVCANVTGLGSLCNGEAHQSCCLLYLASQLHQQATHQVGTTHEKQHLNLAGGRQSCQLACMRAAAAQHPNRENALMPAAVDDLFL